MTYFTCLPEDPKKKSRGKSLTFNRHGKSFPRRPSRTRSPLRPIKRRSFFATFSPNYIGASHRAREPRIVVAEAWARATPEALC